MDAFRPVTQYGYIRAIYSGSINQIMFFFYDLGGLGMFLVVVCLVLVSKITQILEGVNVLETAFNCMQYFTSEL